MIARTFTRAFAFASIVVLGLSTACGHEGETPACGDYPEPYDVRVPEAREIARAALIDAAARGCSTLPAGYLVNAGGAGGESPVPNAGGTSGEVNALPNGDSGAGGALEAGAPSAAP